MKWYSNYVHRKNNIYTADMEPFFSTSRLTVINHEYAPDKRLIEVMFAVWRGMFFLSNCYYDNLAYTYAHTQSEAKRFSVVGEGIIVVWECAVDCYSCTTDKTLTGTRDKSIVQPISNTYCGRSCIVLCVACVKMIGLNNKHRIVVIRMKQAAVLCWTSD